MLRMFFSLPPVGYFVIAALLIAGGYYMQNVENGIQAEREQALAGDAPSITDLGDFTRENIGLAREVNVAAQINNDYTYTLYKGTESDSNAHVMWVLFDPEADGSEKTVNAAIVIRERDADKFTDWLIANASAMGQISPIFNINGLHKTSTSYDEIAEDAMDDERLTRAPGFFYIEPFFNGRAAGLAPRSTSDGGLLMVALVAGLGVAAIGVVKTIWRRRRRAAF